MTADERLALIRVKTERARKHLADLALIHDQFLGTDPCEYESRPNPQTGKQTRPTGSSEWRSVWLANTHKITHSSEKHFDYGFLVAIATREGVD